jgi:hypothetical protein
MIGFSALMFKGVQHGASYALSNLNPNTIKVTISDVQSISPAIKEKQIEETIKALLAADNSAYLPAISLIQFSQEIIDHIPPRHWTTLAQVGLIDGIVPEEVKRIAKNMDYAMRGLADVQGGIDLTNAGSGITVTKDAQGGVKVDFDPALIARIKQEGVQSAVPVIINVTLMSPAQIRPLLGFDLNNQ